MFSPPPDFSSFPHRPPAFIPLVASSSSPSVAYPSPISKWFCRFKHVKSARERLLLLCRFFPHILYSLNLFFLHCGDAHMIPVTVVGSKINTFSLPLDIQLWISIFVTCRLSVHTGHKKQFLLNDDVPLTTCTVSTCFFQLEHLLYFIKNIVNMWSVFVVDHYWMIDVNYLFIFRKLGNGIFKCTAQECKYWNSSIQNVQFLPIIFEA